MRWGCSVNDVLLASVAGALRQYLVAKGDDTEGVEVRALVPVNLRPEAVLRRRTWQSFRCIGAEPAGG